jgi:hypothetical protein
MAGSTISGKVTTTVTLGSASYPSPLTITGSGDIAVSAPSATGIDAPAGSGIVINDGTVTGGAAIEASDGSGGVGVYLATGAALTNQGTITGGAGHPGRLGAGGYGPGPGGAGVLIDGGTLTNRGTVAGGYGVGEYGPTGSGANLLAGTLINTGTIIGGSANLDLGFGGAGVNLATSATLLNNGTIVGGYGLQGGSGVSIAASGSFAITGVVTGGAAHLIGGAGVLLADGGSLDNTGTVTGGGGGGQGGIGIYLVKGGTLTNAATIVGGTHLTDTIGAINGTDSGGAGVSLSDGGIVVNAAFISGGTGIGVIAGDGGDGIDLGRGGTVTNDANATINGGAGGYHNSSGVYGGGAGASLIGGTLANAGTITGGTGASTGGGNGGTGVSLTAGAMVTNTGSIGGGIAGYDVFGGHGGTGVVIGSSSSAGTVTNDGLITGGNDEDIQAGGAASFFFVATSTGGAGVSVAAGDTLINNGTIVAGVGMYVGASASVYMAAGSELAHGSISGGDGAVVAGGGTLINAGTIVSGVGVYLAAGATLTTGDAISGGVYGGVTADAVLFAGAGTLGVDADASFVGQVVASATSTDVLYLTADLSNGTLSGIGTQLTNFAQITVGADASWTLTGANTIAAGTTLTELSGASLTDTGTLVNDGSIVLDPSTMTLAALIGTGPVAIDAGSTLEVQGTISGGETLVFGGSGAYLHLDSPDSVAGSITNFTSGETIDLSGINPATVSYTSGDLTFSGGGDIALGLADGGTVVASASTDGAEITVRLCFCANTLLLTPSGERPVQDLAVGDLVTTHRGEVRPIVWVGVGKVLATRGQRSAATPVIVRRGALADNVPNRDLRVTKGHALLLDCVLIPVEFLINHRLIEWDDRAQEVELYHVELASHDVLVANGAPAETYRDDGNRWLFRNANSGWDLPPQAPCAPVLTGGPVVDAAWRRLLRRAGPRPGFVLTDDPDLHLLVDGDRLDARERRGGARIFHLPAQPVSVRIVSRSAAPAELGLARDPRVLGVAIRRIALRQGARFHVIEAEDAALTQGFYPFEQGDGVRWTDGDAALPEVWFKGFEGPMELVLHVGGTTRYPLIGAADLHAAAA